MATTNFATLTNRPKKVWGRDVWKMARNNSFINQFAGRSHNSMVQRITELTKSERGTQAVLHLVADLEQDGVVADNTLEGNEEAIKAYDKIIQIDQLRHANRKAGRMAEQQVVIRFREESRDVLAYWLADRMDQLAFLTLSGVNYGWTNSGAERTDTAFPALTFAGDVTAPSTNRHLRWDSAGGGSLLAGNIESVDSADTITYKTLVQAKAHAKEQYIRGIRGPGGQEIYHVFLTPSAMADLRLDSDFLANVRNAMPRSRKNDLFSGVTSVMVDGMVVHEYRHVFNTKKAAAGINTDPAPDYTADPTGQQYKWGANRDVDGCRMLLCGAQAMGMADIGDPIWFEKEFDYENQWGISVSKIFGFLKPSFHSIYANNVEDFGVLAVDVATST